MLESLFSLSGLVLKNCLLCTCVRVRIQVSLFHQFQCLSYPHWCTFSNNLFNRERCLSAPHLLSLLYVFRVQFCYVNPSLFPTNFAGRLLPDDDFVVPTLIKMCLYFVFHIKFTILILFIFLWHFFITSGPSCRFRRCATFSTLIPVCKLISDGQSINAHLLQEMSSETRAYSGKHRK